jgi:hypothetical protein
MFEENMNEEFEEENYCMDYENYCLDYINGKSNIEIIHNNPRTIKYINNPTKEEQFAFVLSVNNEYNRYLNILNNAPPNADIFKYCSVEDLPLPKITKENIKYYIKNPHPEIFIELMIKDIIE